MITEHQQVAYQVARIEDLDAIGQAVQLYIDAMARGDKAALAEAFHPDARMYGALGEQRYDVPIGEFAEIVAESPADAAGTFRARIASIAQVGDAASATVVEEGFWGRFRSLICCRCAGSRAAGASSARRSLIPVASRRRRTEQLAPGRRGHLECVCR